MTKMFIIDSCNECSYRVGQECFHPKFKYENEKVITNEGLFPDWCPLEEVEEDNK